MANTSTLPTIDLSAFFREGDEEGKKKSMAQISEACSDYGFFLAMNHGVPVELMSQALQVSRTFFQCKDEEKLEYSPKPEAPTPAGYFRSPQHSQEKCEHFFVVSPTSGFNTYPTNPPQFKQVLEEVYPYFTKLGMLVESIINDCLDLPPNFLKEYNDDRSWDVLLALHYVPAISNTEINIGKTCHTDASSVTFVFQDGVEGLEFYRDGKWIPVVPPHGTLVINIGDLIQVLSNDKFKSAAHRVVRPVGRSRCSFAYFYTLNGDKWVEPLQHFTNEKGESPKYRGFQNKEYTKLRLRNRTHPPSSPQDLIGNLKKHGDCIVISRGIS